MPGNVRIIGTMNTADRSVAHLDAAVRRRFGFLAVPPDSTVVEGFVGAVNLASLLDELNRRIRALLSADHQVGQAALITNGALVDSEESLAAAFYQDIVPLLEDYALGDAALLAQLLGSEVVSDGVVMNLEPEDLCAVLAKEFAAGDAVSGV